MERESWRKERGGKGVRSTEEVEGRGASRSLNGYDNEGGEGKRGRVTTNGKGRAALCMEMGRSDGNHY